MCHESLDTECKCIWMHIKNSVDAQIVFWTYYVRPIYPGGDKVVSNMKRTGDLRFLPRLSVIRVQSAIILTF